MLDTDYPNSYLPTKPRRKHLLRGFSFCIILKTMVPGPEAALLCALIAAARNSHAAREAALLCAW